jgi:hypothetical protein
MAQSFLCIAYIPMVYAGGRATQEQLPIGSGEEMLKTEFDPQAAYTLSGQVFSFYNLATNL